MQQLEINQSREIKRCTLFRLHRVTTPTGEQLLLKSSALDAGNGELLRREQATLARVGSLRVARSVGLVHFRDRPGACYADFQGGPLTPACLSDLDEITLFTRELCAVLDDFHDAGLLLLGLAPSSFLREPSGRLQLIDAPFAQPAGQTSGPSETDWIQSPFLPYAAPEAVRALACPLDRTTDLYSLGALLYELLSGRPPFERLDPAELIQAHLARRPPPLRSLVPELPAALCDAIMVLLAKNPSERPASTREFLGAAGLSTPRSETGLPPEAAPRGPTVTPAWSPRVYGREALLRELQSSLEESIGCTVTLLRGEPGSGKTSLLEELRQAPTVAMSCWGKFARGAGQPLSGWVTLARSLADASLSASPSEFQELREKFAETLGASGPALVALAEEWDAVLECGSGQTDHVEGGLNRTAVALQRLLGSYCDPATPLWLVLDDLQWADASSLRILELVLTLPNPPNLRVLGALRSPEPGDDTGLLDKHRQDLERRGISVTVLELDGLADADLRAFVQDSLGPVVDGIDELVRFVSAKTRGNPFFVRELLATLVQEGALTRDGDRWRWSGLASSIALPNSLLDLLIRRVHQLPEETKLLLSAAACLGEGATHPELCGATGLDPDTVRRLLSGVVAAGLLEPRSAADEPVYVFAHDRVLEASLALASEAERGELSIRLFDLLTANAGGTRALTFTLANLFNAGSNHVDSDSARISGACANQAAGEAAKAKGAYVQALSYLECAVELLQRLPEHTRWSARPDLTRNIYCHAAEAALLCSRFELNAAWCGEVLAHSRTALEKAAAYEFLIRGLAAQKRYSEAVEKALQAHSEFNVRFPRNPTMAHVIWGYIWTLRRVKSFGASRLLQIPQREDAEMTAISRLMQVVYAIAHFNKPELFPLFVYRQIERCLTHGHDAYSPQAYSAFCIVLAGLGEVELAQKLSEVSQALPSTPTGEKVRCRSLFGIASFVVPWIHPVRESFPKLTSAAKTALEHGDFEFFGYAVTMRTLGQLYTGGGLSELTIEFDQILSQLQALAQERCVLMQSIVCEAAHELREGMNDGPLSGRFYERVSGLQLCKNPMDHTLVFHHYLAELCVAAHFEELESARQAVERIQPFVANGAFGSHLLATYLFYEAWVLGKSGTSRHGGLKARRRLGSSQKRLKGWAERAPANFSSKLHFVAAERLRLAGRLDEAARRYEAAIEAARAQGFLNEAALAHERAASLWQERDFPRLAGQHMRDAYNVCVHWGALAVAERLSSTFPQHPSLLPLSTTTAHDGTRPHESLDYYALIKASQAISGETLQPRLLERLLRTIMEHTAAQRGVLLLDRRGELFVEAEADVDRPEAELLAEEPAETSTRVCRSIVRYVARLEKHVMLAEATQDPTFGRDAYVQSQRPRSVLCMPITYQGKLLGLVYLENNRVSHVFTRFRLEIVGLLTSQAAISIANARFHALELEAQQAKISPHFLFNALSSLAELATIDGARAETAIVKLAHLYRYILASSPTEMVSLDRELSVVRDYLSLEKLRFGAKLEFSVTHEGPLADVRIPGLLIQPLVENSIRHAVAPKLTDGRVWVHAQVRGDRCSIVVQDDGDGTKHTSGGTGFGLRSVQQRLELVYGTRFSFAISQRSGYRVELEVPCCP